MFRKMTESTITSKENKDSGDYAKRLLGFIFTPPFLILFGSTLVLFQPLLILAKNIFGLKAFKFTLEMMNRFILWELRFAGTRFSFQFREDLPADRPLIVVSNHQSMYDIPMLLLGFRKHHPKFISKIELARGIPSISYALRNMGSALINRSEQKEALKIIAAFARDISAKRYAACIFPEGTRARDGQLKPFKQAGLVTLIKNMPDALIVPVVISGAWELLRYKFCPLPFGVRVVVRTLEPIEVSGRDAKELARLSEEMIGREMGRMSEGG